MPDDEKHEPEDAIGATRVAVIDDDGRFRDTLAALLDVSEGLTLADAFADAKDAVEAAATAHARGLACPWHIAIMDMNMPAMDGIEGTARLKALYPEVRVLVLTVYEDPATIVRAVCAGADGYLLKHTGHAEVLEHVQMIRAGGAPLTPGVAAKLLDVVRQQVRTPPSSEARLELSVREREVLQGLVAGMAYKQVAAELEISIDTVRTYVRRLYKKLRVHSVAEAVSRAIREALV